MDIKFFALGLHILFGVIAIDAFLWAFAEVLKASPERIQKAKKAVLIGVIALFITWAIGGFYYVNFYPDVRAIIKAGPASWAHYISMETKEHAFIIVPLFGLMVLGLLKKYGAELLTSPKFKKLMLWNLVFLTLASFSMAFFGFLVSYGARLGLLNPPL